MPLTTTSAALPMPPSTAVRWFQHPPNLLAANPARVAHTQHSPSTYTMTLAIPLLWFFKFTVATEAVFESRADGVFVRARTGGVLTSSEWTVVAAEEEGGGEGCVVREEFRVLECWWGLGWFVRWTAAREHVVLMEGVVAGLRAAAEGERKVV